MDNVFNNLTPFFKKDKIKKKLKKKMKKKKEKEIAKRGSF
jgi:hypothetical protein